MQTPSTSVAITGGTQTLTAAQYAYGYVKLTGTPSSSATLQFPANVGSKWIVDATAVTLNAGITITLQANGVNWATTIGATNLYEVTYGGTGKLYGTTLSA